MELEEFIVKFLNFKYCKISLLVQNFTKYVELEMAVMEEINVLHTLLPFEPVIFQSA